jgi:hypothetical protein
MILSAPQVAGGWVFEDDLAYWSRKLLGSSSRSGLYWRYLSHFLVNLGHRSSTLFLLCPGHEVLREFRIAFNNRLVQFSYVFLHIPPMNKVL